MLKKIKISINQYHTKEKIVLNVYESSSNTYDDVRDTILVGFKKYTNQCKKKSLSELKTHTVLFSLMFIIGVIIEFLLYSILDGSLPVCIVNTLDIIAWVFVWQFAAYMAFEFVNEIKNLKRLNQILNIKYVFIHWE